LAVVPAHSKVRRDGYLSELSGTGGVGVDPTLAQID
jgi:hypothetical protein